MLAYRVGNNHSGRRIALAIKIARVLAPELYHGVQFSRSRFYRSVVLANVNVGMTLPLLATTLALKNDPAAERRLRSAFPHQRRILAQLSGHTDDLPISRSFNEPRPEYLAVARKAIFQLGGNADRFKLLQFAEKFLENTRKSQGEIS